ncbi:MAG: LLM class flavin-dependent oxidoreductase [Chloroflexi bacterium]|nr:LLM class flavin-dependent oxidoreductase [Chloroflexota bacterium]
MQIGVMFPQFAIGNDPAAIRAYAQALEGLGYAHIAVSDHVLGASVAHRPDWRGPYTSADPFHEALTLAAFLAAAAPSVALSTCVLVLPQRRTGLVLRQALALRAITGGRFRLGVGIGWNPVEFQALRRPFATRAGSVERQIAALRTAAPDLPVWTGGWVGGSRSEAALQRIGRLADGWMPLALPPDEDTRAALARLWRYAEDSLDGGGPDEWAQAAAFWRAAGATHLTLHTGADGRVGPDGPVTALRAFRETVGMA